MTQARARTTDPWTSWAAARSVTNIRERQAAVLMVIVTYGPSEKSLAEIVSIYQAAASRPDTGLPQQSDSGIRTRTKELQDAGWILETGTRKNAGGRKERLLKANIQSGTLFP